MASMRYLILALILMACQTMAAQTPPLEIIGTVPAYGAQNVAPGTTLSVTFNRTMGVANAANFIVHTSRTGDAVLQGTYSGQGTAVLSFTPAISFAANEAVCVTLTADLADDAGNALGLPYVLWFRTGSASSTCDFSTPARVVAPFSCQARDLVAADMNGDGIMDVVAHAIDTTQSTAGMSVNLQDAFGAFSIGSQFNYNGSGSAMGGSGGLAQGVRAADLDGNGWPDIVVGNLSVGPEARNYAYFNDGAGGFDDANSIQVGGEEWTQAVALADFDGDGEMDIACANGLQQNYVYLNKGAGDFDSILAWPPTYTRLFGGGGNDHGMDIGDIDLDGDVDIVTCIQNGSASCLCVNANDGAANFPTCAGVTHHSNSLWSVTIADIDGDGYPDVVAGGKSQSSVFFNDGAGGFNATDYSDFGSGADAAYELASGDIDGDGAMDIFIAAGGVMATDRTSKYFLNDGTGNLGSGTPVGTPNVSSLGAEIADMDGDGDLDLLAPRLGGNAQIMIYSNGGNVTIASPASLPNAEAGVLWQHTLSANYGTTPYTWSMADPANAVWNWLSLSMDGLLSGTPPQSAAHYAFDIIVTDAAGAADLAAFSLYINGPASPLPWTDGFEAGHLGPYVAGGGALARAAVDGGGAMSGMLALRLDVTDPAAPWNVPDAASIDDPAQWENIDAAHTGTLEWRVDGSGVGAVDASFSYTIMCNPNPGHYANLALEWSNDGGQIWHVATGGTFATANGVYRGDTGGALHSTLSIGGLGGQSDLRFRFHWLIKWSNDGPLPTWIAIDDVSIVAAAVPLPQPPVVQQITPATGGEAGGDLITLAGANLDSVTSVSFGGVAATIVSVSPSSAEILTPAHAPGDVSIVLVTPVAILQLAAAFTYYAAPAAALPAITSIDPAAGPASGGAIVTINGAYLDGAIVSFGNTAATILANLGTSITVRTPAHAHGAVDIVVATAGGTAELLQAYTYTMADEAPETPDAFAAAGGGCSLGGGLGGLFAILAIGLAALAMMRRRHLACA